LYLPPVCQLELIKFPFFWSGIARRNFGCVCAYITRAATAFGLIELWFRSGLASGVGVWRENRRIRPVSTWIKLDFSPAVLAKGNFVVKKSQQGYSRAIVCCSLSC
jgi:hypothetical protein